MDFYAHQDLARKKTAKLIVLFALGVLSISVMMYVVTLVAMLFFRFDDSLRMYEHFNAANDGGPGWQNQVFKGGAYLIDPELFLWTTLGTLALIGLGTLYKVFKLRGGGRVIAEELGGTLLSYDTASPEERRLLNVVEEMAIASSTPVPPVYILRKEGGINAFAAGYTPSGAVIGVTRGAVEMLSREQLQGVIAHEFSHILSGDMRLNIKLVGVLHGIVLISIIGHTMMHVTSIGDDDDWLDSRDRSFNLFGIAIFLIGALTLLVGYAGSYFGSWIKSGVSKQREYLADASAVQFTRNTDGIVGALVAISGMSRGGKLRAGLAPEASHMFFAKGVAGMADWGFASHPPILDRINRLDKSIELVGEPGHARSRAGALSDALLSGFGGGAGSAGPDKAGSAADASAAHTPGDAPTPEIARAREMIAGIPDMVYEAAHEPIGGQAAIFALLLDRDKAVRAAQLRAVERYDGGVHIALGAMAPHIMTMPRASRLPLLEVALGPLSLMSQQQYGRFRTAIESLIKADRKVSLFEWCAHRVVTRHLDQFFGVATPTKRRYTALEQVREASAMVLGFLASNGHAEESHARSAFDAGANTLGLAGLAYPPKEARRASALGAALDAIAQSDEPIKRAVMEACSAVVADDGVVHPREGELVRAFAATLDIPVPILQSGFEDE